MSTTHPTGSVELAHAPPFAGPFDAPDRWRPSRAGLVNVWRYQEETFEFHRGRLLLRGPNGSGKSMALELLLPFLLDANASPTRLSSAAKSRGGLYDRVLAGGEGSSRVGFLWGEFVRDGDAGPEAFTIGARLRVSTATGRVTTEWFTTSLRVGEDLSLLDETRTPLSKQALEDAIGEHGNVHSSADDYRAAVRALLFPGFTEKQYEAIITALLALRREKVSQNLTLARLSEILSASLPAVDERDIAEIAEGFEKLDRHRDTIAGIERDLKQMRHLAARQRSYARAVLLAQANTVRTAETRRDDVTKRERRARTGLDEATEELTRLKDEDRTADERIGHIDAETDTLKNLDEYRQGGRLGSMRDQLRRLDEQAEHARQTVARREQAHADGQATSERMQRAAADATRNEDAAKRELNETADRLNAVDIVAQAAEQPDPDRCETLLEAWVDGRRGQLAEIRDAAGDLERTVTERRLCEHRVEDDRLTLDRAVEDRTSAERRLEQTIAEYAASVRAWASECTILDPSVLAERLPIPPEDPAAVRVVVERRASEVRSTLAVLRSDVEQQLGALEEQRVGLEDERRILAAGHTIEPDAPSWRSPREEGTGQVPLWRLVDFRDDCPTGAREGIEAALLAAGLLDALVTPEGRAMPPEGGADALLDASSDQSVTGPSLADVLEPVDDTPVPRDVTVRLLRSIALGSTGSRAEPAAVGTEGTFRLTVLTGRGAPREPRFIGAAARERQRARRIGEIDDALAAVARQAAGLHARLDDIARQFAALEAEAAASPDGESVSEARVRVETARSLAAGAESRLRASQDALAEAERRVREAQRHLMVLAAQHGLPTDEAALVDHATALDGFGRRASTWARRRREHRRARLDLDDALGRIEEIAADLDDARETLEAIMRQDRDLRARLETLERSVGSEYREVVARIDELGRERDTLHARRRELATIRSQLDRKLGNLETELATVEEARSQAEAERDEAHRLFVAGVADGIAADADAAIDATELGRVSSVLDVARAVAQRFGDLAADQAAIAKSQAAVAEAVHASRQTLGGRVDISHEPSERGWWLLRTFAAGIRRSVSEYAEMLDRELGAARTELKEEEQRLFDETLTGSVREAVAERIRRSNQLVERINTELSRVRTAAAGVHVRLRWEVDPEQPDAIRSARRLLLKDPADLGDSDRDALYEFFRARIEQVRAELETAAGWEERLRAVLDYRIWHRFTLEIAHRDWEGFMPATSTRIQRLSTGERSLALHLPMLASIAAHYAAGSNGHETSCPRLILLDELFVGVDVTNREQLFELFVTWDLDAVLTSDQEWCAYKTLDGIAIHHLHADGDEPVTSSRFVWDGRHRIPAAVQG